MFVGWFDLKVIDGFVNFFADSVSYAGEEMRKLQTGKVQAYVMFMLFAVALGVLYRAIF